MMNNISMRKLTLLTFIMFSTYICKAEKLIVVANTDKQFEYINKNDIRDVFMRNNSKLDLTPIGLKPENQARSFFNVKIVGLTESRIQSYWAQMRFSGRKKPPKEFDNYEDVIKFLMDNKDSVAYLPAGMEVPSNLKVIFKA